MMTGFCDKEKVYIKIKLETDYSKRLNRIISRGKHISVQDDKIGDITRCKARHAVSIS